MEIAAVLAQWGNPLILIAFLIFLALSVKALKAKLSKTDETVEKIRDNHLAHISTDIKQQSVLLARIETKVDLLPCKNPTKSKEECPNE